MRSGNRASPARERNEAAMIEDPDFEGWEQRGVEPVEAYQVEFWSQPSGPMWHCDATRLLEVSDVEEVFAWAREHADGRNITIYAEVNRGPERGRLRLAGVDPTAAK